MSGDFMMQGNMFSNDMANMEAPGPSYGMPNMRFRMPSSENPMGKQGGSFMGGPPMPMFGAPPGLSPPPKPGMDGQGFGNMSGGLMALGGPGHMKDNPMMMNMKIGGPVKVMRTDAEDPSGQSPQKNISDLELSEAKEDNPVSNEKAMTRQEYLDKRRTNSKSLDISSRVFVPKGKGQPSPAKQMSSGITAMLPGGM